MKLIDILGATPIPIGYRIAFLTNFWREPLLRRMEREFGIIRPEWTVLICLMFRDGVSSRDICEITEQPSNTVSRGVASLENKQLIKRKTDPNDARRTRLFITDAGRELHDRVMALFVEAERSVLKSLTTQEAETLTNLLDKMARDVVRWSKLPPYKDLSEED